MAKTINLSTFTALTTISSNEMNNNFTSFRGNLVPIETNTSTSSDGTHDLGGSDERFKDAYISQSIYIGSVNTSGGWKIVINTATTGLLFQKYSSTTYVTKGEWG